MHRYATDGPCSTNPHGRLNSRPAALIGGAFSWNILRVGSLCAWRHAMVSRSLPGGLSDGLAFEPCGCRNLLKPRIRLVCGASSCPPPASVVAAAGDGSAFAPEKYGDSAAFGVFLCRKEPYP
jgi:hypothetical protein